MLPPVSSLVHSIPSEGTQLLFDSSFTDTNIACQHAWVTHEHSLNIPQNAPQNENRRNARACDDASLLAFGLESSPSCEPSKIAGNKKDSNALIV